MNKVPRKFLQRYATILIALLLAVLACDLPGTPTVAPPATSPIAPVSPTVTLTSDSTPVNTLTLTPTLPPPAPIEVCNGGIPAVTLIVDPLLYLGIHPSLSQFESDLCADGYRVIERLSDFDSPNSLRAYLGTLYTDTGGDLVGAILIGDLPYAYQWVTLSSTFEEAISYQYYADVDGLFDVHPGTIGPSDHVSYDIHTGNVDWELWIGVLPLYKGDHAQTVAALKRYFAKNHAYRIGDYVIPRAFLQITEHHSATTMAEHNEIMGFLTTGTYAWTPFSSGPNASFYFNSTAMSLTASQGYAAISAGVADFTVADAHGYWGGHGLLDIPWAETNPIETVFFWSNGCAVGDLDHADNFLTAVLYSPTSMVLVAKGTTNNSGGMGNNTNGFFGHNIAAGMSSGQSFGMAIVGHVNVPLVWPWSDSREFHFATAIVLGDPTLRIQP